jgi:RimJ/RimL family protein N-acetyltransferase
MYKPELLTPRLRLRVWRESDREPFRWMNADPAVMEFFPGALSFEESDALADRIETHFREHGFGLWAVEVPGIAPFIGYVGLAVPAFQAHFTPCVEIGWRLARAYWGKGYATEAAQEELRFAFDELSLGEVVSFTVPSNIRSRRVMERLGMQHQPSDDFEHPRLPEGHRLRHHVLYRLTSEGWRKSS